MNVAQQDIDIVIDECIRFLQDDNSVIQNFLDTEGLEEYWDSIQTEEHSIEIFKEKRQSIEDEILILNKTVRGIYISMNQSISEPNWMRLGHKNKDEAIATFFSKLKSLDTSFKQNIQKISGKSLQDFRRLYIYWKIARKRELDAPKFFRKKNKQSRILKKVLENMVELSRLSQEV